MVSHSIKRAMRLLFHSKGHGVHSPFAFNFITFLVEERLHYYAYTEIEEERKRLLKQVATHRRPMMSRRVGRLLFRLSNKYAPQSILEIGTSWGISSRYLTAPQQATKLYCIEGRSDVWTVAQGVCPGAQRITWQEVTGKERFPMVVINETISSDFIKTLVTTTNESSFWVMTNIHRRSALWHEIVALTQVSVAFDLYTTGIVFFNPKLHRRYYKVGF